MPTDKPATSFRLSEEGKAILAELSRVLGVSQTAVIEMAIRRLARSELAKSSPANKPAKKKK